MATQAKATKTKAAAKAETVEAVAPAPAPSESAKRQAMLEGMDELLDEIDEVLEVNAAEFVAAYVQKGGE